MLKFVRNVRPSNHTIGVTCLAVGSALFIALGSPVSLATESPLSESCPTREATLAAVATLLGQAAVSAEVRSQIRVTDYGAWFAISAKDKSREYLDNSRNCAERARMAAVFVALTLAPPDISDLSDSSDASPPEPDNKGAALAVVPVVEPPPSARSKARPNQVPIVEPAPTRIQLELGAKALLNPGGDAPPLEWGAQARGLMARSESGLGLGVEIAARSHFALNAIRVEQQRYILDLSLRRTVALDSARLALDVGPLVSLLQMRQTAPGSTQLTRWLPGLRVGMTMALANRALTPFVGLDAQLIPFRIPIAAEPEGIVGHTSVVWVGASLGVAASLH